MRGISRAIDRSLNDEVSPWKLCRPASDFKVWSIEQQLGSHTAQTVSSATLRSCSVHKWRPSDEFRLELASVPIITDQYATRAGLSLGTSDVLKRLFKDMDIPLSVLSCFLNNRIQFNSFPGHSDSRAVFLLNFRQWAIAWSRDTVNGSSKAILLWMGGSWTKHGIARYVKPFLDDIADTYINHESPGLLGVLLCARNVAESLADLDEEAFRTEWRLRRLIQGGQLRQEDELGRLSAAHSWLAARSIRERARLSAVSSFLEHISGHRQPGGSQPVPTTRAIDLEALQLLTTSLTAQASKLCEESSMHLSTIFNLIAQRDQATNLAIAAASREIALQSKVDQANSLEIARASRKIAEESRKDSNAMKMIAIVTMVYLPGTFVATCFSMDLFQWTARASDVVNARIWVYFLFTGVLTILTLGCFAAWTWCQDRQFPQANIEAQSSSLGKDGYDLPQRPAQVTRLTGNNNVSASVPTSIVSIPPTGSRPRSVLGQMPKTDIVVDLEGVPSEKQAESYPVTEFPARTQHRLPHLMATTPEIPRSASPFQANLSSTANRRRGIVRQSSESDRSRHRPDPTFAEHDLWDLHAGSDEDSHDAIRGSRAPLARGVLHPRSCSRPRPPLRPRSHSRSRSLIRDIRSRYELSKKSSNGSLSGHYHRGEASPVERARGRSPAPTTGSRSRTNSFGNEESTFETSTMRVAPKRQA